MHLALIRHTFQRRVVFGADLRHFGVRLAGLELEHLRVLVGDDLDNDAIEQRQLGAVAVGAEVMAVAREDHALTRAIVGEDKRTKTDDVRRRRRYTPRRCEFAGRQWSFQFVLRQDGQVVEHAKTRTEGTRKRQAHGQRIDGACLERLPKHL